mgnify:CR=1 FL=1
MPYVLSKRFVHRKRCDLTVGGQQLDGTDAEDHLARLLGFDFALKGASKRSIDRRIMSGVERKSASPLGRM